MRKTYSSSVISSLLSLTSATRMASASLPTLQLSLAMVTLLTGRAAGETVQVSCTEQHFRSVMTVSSSALSSSARCMPREKVIRLSDYANMSVETMTPNYITAMKCGGACPSTSHSCVAIETKPKHVPVMIANCGLESGRCDKQCHTIIIQEELSCKCDCLEAQKNCGKGKVFRSDSCSCECMDKDAAKQCRDLGRIWDIENCKCGCPAHTLLPCSTGLVFDESTCTCLEAILRSNAVEESSSGQDTRVERSELIHVQDGFGNMEWIIIAVLSGIIVILIIIIAIFIKSVTELRSRLFILKEFQAKEGEMGNGHIAPNNKVVTSKLESEMRAGSIVEEETSYYFPCTHPTPPPPPTLHVNSVRKAPSHQQLHLNSFHPPMAVPQAERKQRHSGIIPAANHKAFSAAMQQESPMENASQVSSETSFISEDVTICPTKNFGFKHLIGLERKTSPESQDSGYKNSTTANDSNSVLSSLLTSDGSLHLHNNHDLHSLVSYGSATPSQETSV